MAGSILSPWRWQVLEDGEPLPGALLDTWLSGTSTPHPVYADAALVTPLDNPVEADADGVFPVMFLDSVAYRMRVRRADGTTFFASQDNISNINQLILALNNTWTGTNTFNGAVVFGSTVQLPSVAYASLPAATAGRVARVSDSARGLWIANGTTWAAVNGRVFDVGQFGAVGNGVADDTAAIQAAVTAAAVSGGTVRFGAGLTYLVSNQGGGTDQYAIAITSNVHIDLNGATIARTSAAAFAPFLIGTPDSNAAPASNVRIFGGTMQGNSILHASSGSQPNDYRTMIQLRNASQVQIHDVRFTNVDSSSIYCMGPTTGDTTTYNSLLSVEDCDFYAASHAIANRALIHAIVCSEVNNFTSVGNTFSWCDDAISGVSTVEAVTDASNSTWTHGSLGSVPRSGRNWTITGNTCYNSSEHALYLGGVGMTITGNTILTDTPSICISDLKVEGLSMNISGNAVTARDTCMNIGVGSNDVTVTGNVFTQMQVSAAGAISCDYDTISAYIDARAWKTFYYALHNLTITGNTVHYVGSQPSVADNDNCTVGVRVFTGTSDANYQTAGREYQIENVIISGNTFSGYTHAVRLIGILLDSLNVTGNTFRGYPLAVLETNYNGTQTLVSKYVIAVDNASALQYKSTLTGNMIYGYMGLFGRMPDTGALTNAYPANVCTGNQITYTDDLDNGEFRAYDSTDNNLCESNTGYKFYASKPVMGPANAWNETTTAQANAGRMERFTNALSAYDDSGNARAFLATAIPTLEVNSATPAVNNWRVMGTLNTMATTISNFTGASAGQEIIVIVGDANTTFDFTGSNLKGNAGVNLAAAADDALYCTYNGTNWYCVVAKGS